MGPMFVNVPSQRTANNLAYLLDIAKLAKPFMLVANVAGKGNSLGYIQAVSLAPGGEVRVANDMTPPNWGASYCTTPEHLPQLVTNLLAAVTNLGGDLKLYQDGAEEVIA
jgi:hypothetical protein